MRGLKKTILILIALFVIIELCCFEAGAVTAKANIAPLKGNAPLNVMFTDISEGSPVEWHWDYGDGFTGDGPQSLHTYMSPGVYTVKLVVFDIRGISDTGLFTDLITVYRNPLMPDFSVAVPSFSADFTGTPQSGPASLGVRFSDLSKGEPTTWYWDFGDGTTSSEQNPIHVYMNPGKYTVNLKISRDTNTGYKERVNYISVSESTTEPSIVVTSAMKDPDNNLITNSSDYTNSELSSVQDTLYQVFSEIPESQCESGLQLFIKNETTNQNKSLKILVNGSPLDKVYVWLTKESPDSDEKILIYPKITSQDLLFDIFNNTNTIGSFIPDSSTGLTITDLIPDNTSENSTHYYGLFALDNNGEKIISISTENSIPGLYVIHAKYEDGIDNNCYESIQTTIYQ